MPARRGLNAVTQMAVLFAVSAAAVLIARGFYSHPLSLHYPWSEHVERSAVEHGMAVASLAETRVIAETFSHIIFDARREADYLAGHLPGAMSLPSGDIDRHFSGITSLLTPEQPILVYCSGQDCDESLMLGKTLIEAGYTNITLFVGGMKEWTDANLPVER
jgi:rhodanese-related sulfurtransferase